MPARIQRITAKAAAQGVDWWHWRLVVNDMGTIADINRRWSFAEVFEAHAVLDAQEAAAAYYQRMAAREG